MNAAHLKQSFGDKIYFGAEFAKYLPDRFKC